MFFDFLKAKKSIKAFIRNQRETFYMSKTPSFSSTKSSTSSEETIVEQKPLQCPTCEQSTYAPIRRLKEHHVAQTLDKLTYDGIILPYYSLVPPFREFSGNRNESSSTTGSSGNDGHAEGNNHVGKSQLGVMTVNKQTQTTNVKKVYFSLYGYILDIDPVNRRFMFLSLNDFGDGKQHDDESNKIVNQNVTGMELITAVCNIKRASSKDGEQKNHRRYGEKLTTNSEANFMYHPSFKADTFWVSYDPEQLSCYNQDLELTCFTTSLFENTMQKLFLIIIQVDMDEDGKSFSTPFVREISKEEEGKVKTIIRHYFYGKDHV